MPSLDFKGKSFIYTHHLGVPYRELLVDAAKSCVADGKQPGLDDNLILHGDNLEALKALLPRYAGKVDCIYIDPPYNTGTEGWCYNDAVNAPLMREWLKKAANPVEREDLQRHDKWLCMMWPRLHLLKELLAEDGAIFVSIDDNEVHRLRAVMDEIFGEENFVATILWQKKYTAAADHKGISPMHDFVLAYRNSDGFQRNRLEREDEKNEQYRFEDAGGVYRLSDYTCGKTADERPNLYYEVENPNTGEKAFPKRTRVWAYSSEEHERNVERGLVAWGKDGTGKIPSFKRYKDSLKGGGGTVPSTWWDWTFAGHTDEAKKELIEIKDWEGTLKTITPKPTRLIKRILEIATDEDSLILDSFAGSGTTGHAVLALNAKDGGRRRFILCETEAYADTLTAERVRRVIRGYDFTGNSETELMPPENVTWTTFSKDKGRNKILERIEGIEALEGANYDSIKKEIKDGVLTVVGKKAVKEKMPGLGGSFTYVELGEPMDLERLLAETPGSLPAFANLARYLFHTATGRTLLECAKNVTQSVPPVPGAARGKTARKAVHAGAEASVNGDAEHSRDGLCHSPILIGETEVWRIYMHYRPDEAWLRSPGAALTRSQCEAIAEENRGTGKQVLIFAASKYVNHRTLRALSEAHKVRVDFAQLPYSLHRVQSE